MQETLLADRYLLVEEIGRGGMGAVHRAIDRRTGGPVAVKLLHPVLAADPQYAARLRREAAVAAALTSPRVVRVTDLGEHEGRPFLVMEYVPGPTLREHLDARGRLPVAEALAVALEVARALAAAHAAGVVHRDLKPENVKLVDGHVKVLDFGIARADGSPGLTAAGAFLGTPEYGAPEQAQGGGDARADVYALGVLLYELLSGRRPFPGPGLVALVRQHVSSPVPPLGPNVPAPVRALVARCLAKEPAGRYQSADHLVRDLEAALGVPHPAAADAPSANGAGASTASSATLDLPPAPSSWHDSAAGAPPTGTVTFLFTDLADSTRLWEENPEAMRVAVGRHVEVLRAAAESEGGWVFHAQGDGLRAAFAAAPAAVAAALAAQRALSAEQWPAGAPLLARLALHTGEAEARGGTYDGACVNRLARVLAAGHGGQILLTAATAGLARDRLPAGAWLADLGEHRLPDLDRPERICELRHADLPAELPPLASLEAYRHNLPLRLTAFVGREREMAALRELLGGTRLLTLTGAGGSGKTRLALELAAALLDGYPDGVWLAELAGLVDPALVPSATALALGVRERPGQAVLDTLVEALRPRRLLLVLDNCEHLLEASAELVTTLLRGCPEVRVLATSREPLRAEGETTWTVPPLGLPGIDGRPVGDLAGSDAVRLFVARAAAARPGFALTEQTGPAVAEVCRRLDGIPLALELAAARVRALSVEQIAARLNGPFGTGDRGLSLLGPGSRTAPDRHRTLRAAIDWSHDLLEPDERALFARLAPFAGGFTLEAAEAAGAGGAIAADQVLELLGRLVDKSLVLAEPGAGGTPRFRLLETIRAYALERVAGSGDEEATRRRHAAFFLALAERAEVELTGPRQQAWLEQLEGEHDNLRASLGWCLANREAESALRLASALWRFWQVHGYLSEGRKWLDGALAIGRAGAPPMLLAKASNAAGALAAFCGDYEAAAAFLEESVAVRREQGDQSNLARSLANLGIVARRQGDHARATALYEESLALRRALGDRWGIASALLNVGMVARDQGDLARATTALEESLGLSRELADTYGIANALNHLASVSRAQGDLRRARALHLQSLELFRGLGGRTELAECLEGLASVAVEQGNEMLAARLFGAAESAREAVGAPLSPVDRVGYDRAVGQARARGDEATFAAAWAEGRVLPLEQALSEAVAVPEAAEPAQRLPPLR
jgi:predicted ATPase/class 3 adenylate cyclase